MDDDDLDTDVISETDNFAVWRSDDDDDGYHYHVALGAITLHLNAEEWNELVLLIKSVDN